MAENVSIKLADKDKLLKFQNTYEMYSNQFIPLTVQADLLDRIKLQGMFDQHFSGGSILHLNIEQKLTDPQLIFDLLTKSIKAGVVYQAVNYVLLECADGHMTVGNSDICTVCGKTIINKYTRVVGFLSNVKNWHPVRREIDFPNRKFYEGLI